MVMALSFCLKNSRGFPERWAMMAFASWKHTLYDTHNIQQSGLQCSLFHWCQAKSCRKVQYLYSEFSKKSKVTPKNERATFDSPPPQSPSCPGWGHRGSLLLPAEKRNTHEGFKNNLGKLSLQLLPVMSRWASCIVAAIITAKHFWFDKKGLIVLTENCLTPAAFFPSSISYKA